MVSFSNSSQRNYLSPYTIVTNKLGPQNMNPVNISEVVTVLSSKKTQSSQTHSEQVLYKWSHQNATIANLYFNLCGSLRRNFFEMTIINLGFPN